MLQQSCVLEDVVAVTGGGITMREENGLSGTRHAWIIKPTVVDGINFGNIYNGNWYCSKYVGGEFAMVDHIRELRNKRVHELMQQLNAEEDPNQETILDGAPLIIPKRELFEQIPKIITVNVKTNSMEVDVKVLADWRKNGVLKLELTNTNLDLLLEQPAALPPWTPVFDQPDVCWRPSATSVCCLYWDSMKSKYRWKAMGVNITNMKRKSVLQLTMRPLRSKRSMTHTTIARTTCPRSDAVQQVMKMRSQQPPAMQRGKPRRQAVRRPIRTIARAHILSE